MPDDDAQLYEPFAVQEIFLDGFTTPHIEGHNVRCTAFSVQSVDGNRQPHAVVRLVMPVLAGKLFIQQLMAVLAGEEPPPNDRRRGRDN